MRHGCWLGAMLLIAGCKSSESPAPTLDGPALLSAPFEQVEAAARGQTLRWFFWSGNPTINKYVDGYVKPELAKRWDIALERVPIADVAVGVNRLLAEKQAGKASGGRADLIWINGENFKSAKQGELLFGPFAPRLPNMRYVDAQSPAISHDFGVPNEGYESPWNKAQFVMIHDGAKVPQPPASLEAFTQFLQANPGRFTYPAPPDFTGSVFLRHLLYAIAGGHETLPERFDEALWAELGPKLFGLLKQWAPLLWRKGETYPESSSRLHQLFAQGEVWLTMSYGPETASSKIRDGIFPETARSYLLEGGTIGNTNFVAIPFNAAHKAAAMVTANFLLSPEAQLHKQDPEVWGTITVLDPGRLDGEWPAKLAAVKLGPATLPPKTLAANALPELHPEWAERIEKAWIAQIARR